MKTTDQFKHHSSISWTVSIIVQNILLSFLNNSWLFFIKFFYNFFVGLNHWLGSYFPGCWQSVVLDGIRSVRKPVTSGVPQRSILGPLLFSLFINDMPSCTTSLFGDEWKTSHTICGLILYGNVIKIFIIIMKISEYNTTWISPLSLEICGKTIMQSGKNQSNTETARHTISHALTPNSRHL